jgi:hypothetical protein
MLLQEAYHRDLFHLLCLLSDINPTGSKTLINESIKKKYPGFTCY